MSEMVSDVVVKIEGEGKTEGEAKRKPWFHRCYLWMRSELDDLGFVRAATCARFNPEFLSDSELIFPGSVSGRGLFCRWWRLGAMTGRDTKL